MKKALVLMMAILILWIAISPLNHTQAMRGSPGSPEFGYGAHLDAIRATPDAIRLAANLKLDWISLCVSWQQLAPVANGSLDWSKTDATFKAIELARIPVMVSISQAPTWATTARGPEPALTGKFVLQLLQRYPEAIKAVELFPQANTRAGWGSQPDPVMYATLLKMVSSQVKASGFKGFLVAGGLSPIQTESQSQDMDDLIFLKKLYENGGAQHLQVVSLDFREINGLPLQTPSPSNRRVLRHYEEIRQVMIKNNHTSGLIWITHLSPPSGTINPGDTISVRDEQVRWLAQSYQQIRSQLYIGTTFYDGFSSSKDDCALIQQDGSYHPFYHTLRGFISQSASGGSTARPGRAKEQPILKKP